MDSIDLEEKLIAKKEKKQKKHYLNPHAKAFINKFLKVMKCEKRN